MFRDYSPSYSGRKFDLRCRPRRLAGGYTAPGRRLTALAGSIQLGSAHIHCMDCTCRHTYHPPYHAVRCSISASTSVAARRTCAAAAVLLQKRFQKASATLQTCGAIGLGVRASPSAPRPRRIAASTHNLRHIFLASRSVTGTAAVMSRLRQSGSRAVSQHRTPIQIFLRVLLSTPLWSPA